MSLLRSSFILPLLLATAGPALAKEKPEKAGAPAPPPVNQCLLGTDRLLPLSPALDRKKGGWLEVDPGPPGGTPSFNWVEKPEGPHGDERELGKWRGTRIMVLRKGSYPSWGGGDTDLYESMVCLAGPDDLLWPFFILPPGAGSISAAEHRLPDPAKAGDAPHVIVEGSVSYASLTATARNYVADFALTAQGPRLRTLSIRGNYNGEGTLTVYDDVGKIQRTEKLAPLKKEGENGATGRPAPEAKPDE